VSDNPVFIIICWHLLNEDPSLLEPGLQSIYENSAPKSLQVEFTSSFTVYSLLEGEYIESLK
jgi:hypothetical protein